jgi:hypothetical protein
MSEARSASLRPLPAPLARSMLNSGREARPPAWTPPLRVVTGGGA